MRTAKLRTLGAAGLAAEDAGRLAKASGSGLEVAYAIAMVNDARTRDTGRHLGAVYAQLIGRYKQCWDNVWSYPKRIATGKISADAPKPGAPRFKKRRDAMPLTRQWVDHWTWIERDGKSHINIDALLPQRVASGQELRVEVHRPLPDFSGMRPAPSGTSGPLVKEIKLKRLAARWELTVTVTVEDADYYRDYPATGAACGIDPGRSTAATIANADGTEGRKLIARQAIDARATPPGNPAAAHRPAAPAQ